jgi:fibro-slime domain-containing protein
MNPIKMLVLALALLAASVAAQTVHFYPPDDAKWIAGRSYISQGNPASAKLLTIDPNKCGWYTASVSATDAFRSYAQFWLGKPGSDRIGPNGRMETDFDNVAAFDDPGSGGGVFRLGEIFDRLGSNIYLVADELDPGDPNAGWYGTDPGYNDESRCKFDLAAFIYDTDMSVHPDFSCGEYANGTDAGNGPNTKANCTLTGSGAGGTGAYSTADAYTRGGNLKGTCNGVRKNVVASTLGDDRKIKYNRSGDTKQCWTSEDWFNKAFTSTPGVNVERCYNMPFQQVKTGTSAGSFEFNSDSTKNTNGRLIGGFYPLLLTNRDDADYSQCPTCDAKRPAQNFAPLIKSISAQTFANYTSREGDFADGDTPAATAMGATGNSVWNWADPGQSPTNDATGTREGMNWYLHGNTAIKGTEMAAANSFYCFESHADFYYDPSQVFYFSGDDDIWVYINKKLVIDLGGTHLAAPGKVDLGASAGTLGLEEGNLYPIDIFFCDRRTTMSNVRISTNMYVVQKSTFYNDDKEQNKQKNYMCAAISGGADCASKMGGGSSIDACGPALITGGYTVDFYMVRRGTTDGPRDTIYLSPARGSNQRGACNGTGNSFTCYDGIKVTDAVYTCGGKWQCRGNADATAQVHGLTGNFNVYARLMGPDGKQHPGSKPLLIDNFKSETKTNIVWGTLFNMNKDNPPPERLNDAYGEITKKEQSIIAGKRTPVYISLGSWATEDSFEYEESEVPISYQLTISGGTGLRIYKNLTDDTPHNGSGTLKPSGIDTLYVEGAYDIGEDRDFYLNVTAETDDAPSMKLTVKQPRFSFTSRDGGQINPRGFETWATSGGKPPYVGSPLDMYIVALDPARNNEICSSCSFPLGILRETSATEGPCAVGPGQIVVSDGLKMESGKATVTVRGKEDTGVQECTAKWTISGPSRDVTNATWTGLRFRNAPIPIPTKSYISDRNGDGIGDSVYIEFNKSFGDTLLPVLLGVVWGDSSNIQYFKADGYSVEELLNRTYVENLYRTSGFREANRNYWRNNGFIKGDSIIIIATPTSTFSKGILTTGTGTVSSHIPFVDPEDRNSFQYSSSPTPLIDRISPIVIKAEYEYAGSGNCDEKTGTNGCRELLTVVLSEPVFKADGTDTYDWKNPFYYCLKSQGETCGTKDTTQWLSQTWDNLDWNWERPKQRNDEDTAHSAAYRPNTSGDNNMTAPGGGKGDSIVQMVYYHYKTAQGTTRKPKAGDWIKIRRPADDLNVFVDAEGNPASLRERGVLITGKNPSRRKQLKIQTIKGPNPPVLGGIFEGGAGDAGPWWWEGREDVKNEVGQLFVGDGNVSAILPIVATHPDSVKQYYPGSVGAIFEVSSKFGDIEAFASDECKLGDCTTEDGAPLMQNLARAITLHASAWYHTNLGDYTAHKDNIKANCSDRIFASSTKENCLDNQFNFYLAWDLKANNGRFVGAGAYVGISKFHMQLNYKIDGKSKSKKFEQQEFIEMYGVRRSK